MRFTNHIILFLFTLTAASRQLQLQQINPEVNIWARRSISVVLIKAQFNEGIHHKLKTTSLIRPFEIFLK